MRPGDTALHERPEAFDRVRVSRDSCQIVSDGVFFNTYVMVDGKQLADVVALRFSVSDGLTVVSLDLENVALEFDGDMQKRTQETVTYVSKPDIASHEVTTTT